MSARWWPLGIVLAVQVGVLSIVPARHLAARGFGTKITLRTRPFDPFDVLSGYYVDLRYEVEMAAAAALSEEQREKLREGSEVWVTLRRAEPAWEFFSVSLERPTLRNRDDFVAVPAAHDGISMLRFVGARRLYVPETQRSEAEQVRGNALVDARVGRDGTIALLRMRVGGKTFGE